MAPLRQHMQNRMSHFQLGSTTDDPLQDVLRTSPKVFFFHKSQKSILTVGHRHPLPDGLLIQGTAQIKAFLGNRLCLFVL